MIAPAKKSLAKQAAEVDLAMSVADAPKADEPIRSKKPRLRGRARAQIAQVIEGPSSSKPVGLSPGTKLTRTYKGKKIVVVVMEGNRFEYAGDFYRSLSAVANKITGGHHSGNAWFGLKARAKKEANS